MLIASLALVPAALVAGIPTSPELVPTLALIEVAVFPTGVAYIAFFYAVSVIGASRATFAIYLIPAVALFGGVIIEGSALSMASVAGAACALGAVGLIAYEQRTVRATAR
jgi:drug/metabolite transporter (DMT)-like permease